MYRTRRNTSVRRDYSCLNSVVFGSDGKEEKESLTDIDMDQVNTEKDCSLQNPSGGGEDKTNNLTPKEIDTEMYALAAEEDEHRMINQQQKNKHLMMRAHACDLRQELDQEKNHERVFIPTQGATTMPAENVISPERSPLPVMEKCTHHHCSNL